MSELQDVIWCLPGVLRCMQPVITLYVYLCLHYMSKCIYIFIEKLAHCIYIWFKLLKLCYTYDFAANCYTLLKRIAFIIKLLLATTFTIYFSASFCIVQCKSFSVHAFIHCTIFSIQWHSVCIFWLNFSLMTVPMSVLNVWC